MPQKHGTTWPLSYFPDGDWLQNGAEARPEIVTGLAGNTRLLKEWLGEATPDCIACAPNAPHARTVGHDHSGGVMGRPFTVSLWSAAWGYPDELTDASVAGGRAPRTSVASTVGDAGVLLRQRLRVAWVPGGPPDGRTQSLQLLAAVYSTARISVYLQFVAGAMRSSATLNYDAAGMHYPTLDVSTTPGSCGLYDVYISVVSRGSYATASLVAAALSQTNSAA